MLSPKHMQNNVVPMLSSKHMQNNVVHFQEYSILRPTWINAGANINWIS